MVGNVFIVCQEFKRDDPTEMKKANSGGKMRVRVANDARLESLDSPIIIAVVTVTEVNGVNIGFFINTLPAHKMMLV